MQKLLFLSLCGALAFFQYQLWYGKGGIYDGNRLKNEITARIVANKKLEQRNNLIVEHLAELKGSPELIEARARYELNLVKPGETLVMLPATATTESSLK
jgi:cell division protein FtsB